ncbi:MAG: hypothetical protein MI723_00775, partial [Caulobacterales bacterium]|nr:hypothetical protein [Caulobacterales bacterium]
MQAAKPRPNPGLFWLCATVFMLLAAPRMGLKFGPMPLYAIDALIAITFLRATAARPTRFGRLPFAVTALLIVTLATMSEVVTILQTGEAFEPIYVIVRTLLAMSLFYSASQIIQTNKDVEALLKTAVLGMLVTATLMIATSLPITRGWVVSLVFSNPILEPAFDQVQSRTEEVEGGMRGRSLVGVSILSGAFINIAWPLASLLFRWPFKI